MTLTASELRRLLLWYNRLACIQEGNVDAEDKLLADKVVEELKNFRVSDPNESCETNRDPQRDM